MISRLTVDRSLTTKCKIKCREPNSFIISLFYAKSFQIQLQRPHTKVSFLYLLFGNSCLYDHKMIGLKSIAEMTCIRSRLL